MNDLFSIRKATKEDIETVSKFLDDYYRKDYFVPKKNIVRMITGEVDPKFGKNRQPVHVMLSEDERGISGLAICTRSNTLIQLLVRDDQRGKGLGTKLLEIINPKKIRCKTDVSFGDPTGFYLKHGFKEFQLSFDGTPAKVGKNKNIIVLDKTSS